MMFRGNDASKRPLSDRTALTARIDSDVLEGMHRRYHTAFRLDDEVSASQDSCMHHQPHPLPWALVLAWGGIACSLILILYITLMGGLDLGSVGEAHD